MYARATMLALCIVSLISLTAAAQDAGRVYRIGVLTELSKKRADAWRPVLAKRGYIEGTKATLAIRAADGNFDLLPTLARELVEEQVDIILTLSTPTAIAASHATTTIPIVTVSADPIGAGLVKTLASPGSNVTGLFLPLPELASKRLQLLKETVPALRAVAILWNPNNQAVPLALKATEDAARKLHLRTYPIEVGSRDALKPALQKIVPQHGLGLIIVQDPIMLDLSPEVARFCLDNGIPASHAYRRFVDDGGLMSYGYSLSDLLEAGAEYADKILKGARPQELPMQQPTRVELTINLATAKALHLKIPESVFLRADALLR